MSQLVPVPFVDHQQLVQTAQQNQTNGGPNGPNPAVNNPQLFWPTAAAIAAAAAQQSQLQTLFPPEFLLTNTAQNSLVQARNVAAAALQFPTFFKTPASQQHVQTVAANAAAQHTKNIQMIIQQQQQQVIE